MRLVDSMMTDFVIMTLTETADGEGGHACTWTAGASFRAAAVMDTSTQTKTGEAAGVASAYTVTTRKPAFLKFHDVIKRVSDGLILRITSNGSEKCSPDFGTLDLSQVSAERWVLPA